MIFARRFPRFLMPLLVFVFAAGCNDGGSNMGGFFVKTVQETSIGGVPIDIDYPNAFVNGSWERDLSSNAVGTELSFDGTTDQNGNAHVPDGRLPAVWSSAVLSPCGASSGNSAEFDVTFENPVIQWTCINPMTAATPNFTVVNPYPSQLTITASGFSTQSGEPQLDVYQQGVGLVAQTAASSVSTGGTSATFNFPLASSGAQLGQGLYGYNVWNKTASGLQEVGIGFFSLGSNNTSLTTPYGVDAVDVSTTTTECKFPSRGSPECGTTNQGTSPSVISTLSSTNQIAGYSTPLTVGNDPVAIKAYRTTDTETTRSVGTSLTITTDVSRPSLAIIANFGSNDVSIVNLNSNAVVAGIPVGSEPTAIALSVDQSKAYVANFGSSSVSVISLGTNSQTSVIPVGSSPAALSMDPSGTALWVGGLNYISKIDLSSLSAVLTVPVNGQVTAVALSAQQNSVVYSTVSSSSSYAVEQARSSDGTVMATYLRRPASNYFAAQEVSTAPVPPELLSGGALVSANFGNGLAVIGTPDGFAVIDLINHSTVLQAATGAPVRGIATDPSQGIVYITAPNANLLITVPLPPVN